MAEVRILYETLAKEREQTSDIVRQEFADRLVRGEEETRRLKRELAEMKARMTVEKEHAEANAKNAEEVATKELQKVHQRVKDAISRKEANMNDLKEQYQKEKEEWQKKVEMTHRRVEYLEGLLDQQRKQLLMVKK
ncbi:unnamed protein product [Protopolystoma xenopodis]|uniref:Uncharacterized protein n=1 Tax=Protopolystoma xenopodis TaxID=117903 RepID=A0A3S4ZYU0_9PLAT|nr:unnamed protein product [Protopolystoma xenopodis]